MLPLADNLPQRRFPIVNVSLIVANFAVFLLYELPNMNGAILHAGWAHLLGNMLFLWVFGDSVERGFGRARYLGLYVAGGFAAMMAQAGMTLLFGTAATAHVPCLGASGAIAAVLGAYFVLYPRSRIVLFPVPIVLPAWLFLGFWFLYQFVMAMNGLLAPANNGVAFFARVGGFIFGFVVTRIILDSGRLTRTKRYGRWAPA